MARYDDFEDQAREWLTEVVDVHAISVTSGMGGARENREGAVITGLKSSIQLRSAFASHTLLGWLPEQTHTWYCKALDEQGTQLDIKLGYEAHETTHDLWYKVVGPPELYKHPETGKGHHLETAVKVMAKFA